MRTSSRSARMLTGRRVYPRIGTFPPWLKAEASISPQFGASWMKYGLSGPTQSRSKGSPVRPSWASMSDRSALHAVSNFCAAAAILNNRAICSSLKTGPKSTAVPVVLPFAAHQTRRYHHPFEESFRSILARNLLLDTLSIFRPATDAMRKQRKKVNDHYSVASDSKEMSLPHCEASWNEQQSREAWWH